MTFGHHHPQTPHLPSDWRENITSCVHTARFFVQGSVDRGRKATPAFEHEHKVPSSCETHAQGKAKNKAAAFFLTSFLPKSHGDGGL